MTLFEKRDKLGGVFIAAAAPSYKEKDKMLIAWYEREMAKHPEIEIKLNTEIKDISTLDADEIIVATGAKARKLPVKGYDKGIEAVDFLLGKKEIKGDNVVVIGGGLTGCEIAYELYLDGKKPVIVEMQNDLIVAKGDCLANSSYLRDFFNANKVPVHLETRLTEILDDGVTVTNAKGESFKIDADSVILSCGYIPDPVAKKKGNVHIIGDASAIGNLRTVIWGAWDVCMKL